VRLRNRKSESRASLGETWQKYIIYVVCSWGLAGLQIKMALPSMPSLIFLTGAGAFSNWNRKMRALTVAWVHFIDLLSAHIGVIYSGV
jgi:hypothetical protein